MTHTSPDYHMLVGLRKHLIIVAEATKQLASARQRKKELESTLYDVKYTDKHFGNQPEYGFWVKNARNRYLRDCQNTEYEINRQRNKDYASKCVKTRKNLRFWFTLITIIGVLLAVAIPVLLWTKARFGYDFFMSLMWEGFLPQYDGSVNVYCYVLGSCIAAALIFAYFQKYSDFFSVVYVIVLVGAILFDFVIAFIALSQAWNVHGGWWIIAWIPAFLLGFLIPIAFILKILVAVLVSLVALIILFAIPFGLISMWKSLDSICLRINPKISRVSVQPEERDFYQTEAYRLAAEKDKVEDPIKRQEYLDKVSILRQGLEKQYTILISAEASVITMFETAISKSNAAIAKCPINTVYKNIPDVSGLLYYFELDMADTFKEAAKLMRDDLMMKNLLNLLQKQHREVMDGISTIIIGLDKLDHATRTLANQWNAFAKQSERQHMELMGGINRIATQQERLAEYTNHTIKEVQVSMSRSLSDLKTTYIESSGRAANKIAGGISSASNEISTYLRRLSD